MHRVDVIRYTSTEIRRSFMISLALLTWRNRYGRSLLRHMTYRVGGCGNAVLGPDSGFAAIGSSSDVIQPKFPYNWPLDNYLSAEWYSRWSLPQFSSGKSGHPKILHFWWHMNIFVQGFWKGRHWKYAFKSRVVSKKMEIWRRPPKFAHMT